MAVIKGFQQDPAALDVAGLDLHPEVPNGTVNIDDVFQNLQAFKGEPYSYASPMNCP